jgi:hypothetical protein
VRIVLTGVGDSLTRITDVRVRPMQSQPSLSGTVINTASQGNHDTLPVTINLDSSVPRLLDADGQPFFDRHNVEVSRSERETFATTFTAKERSYRWLLECDYVTTDGSIVTVILDARGAFHREAAEVASVDMFALTGPAAGYGVRYDENYPIDSAFHVVPTSTRT